jgi:hypothetical protein
MRNLYTAFLYRLFSQTLLLLERKKTNCYYFHTEIAIYFEKRAANFIRTLRKQTLYKIDSTFSISTLEGVINEEKEKRSKIIGYFALFQL